MSYDTLKIEPGKQRIDVVDITLERCSQTWSSSPCEASRTENRINYAETATDWVPVFATKAAGAPPNLPTGAVDSVRFQKTSGLFQAGLVPISSDDLMLVGGSATIMVSARADTAATIIISADGRSGTYNVSTGTAVSTSGTGVSSSIAADGTDWYRCRLDITAVASTGITLFLSSGGSSGDGLWISKAQVIATPGAPLDYVLTSGAPRIRTSENACFNSWATCQDTANYLAEDKVISFCTPVSIVPDGCIPFLVSVKGDSGQLDPENSLGKRGQITVNVMDAPHDDTGIDPYVDERAYSAIERGTFWPRFRARFPFYQGRKLEWYQGYYPFSRANAKKRTYIIEDLRGWGRSGKITIVAKDPLKLADDKRAQWPRPSTGVLNTTMTSVSSHTTIDIITGTATEYDLEDYEPVGVVLIGSECIQYTGTTPITDGVRLTGVSRGPIGQYETVAKAHAINDAVQKCAYFNAMKVPKVFQILLERGGNVPAAYIDYPTWEAEYDTWMGGFTVTRLICKPEGVTTIIKELIPQSNTWALWFDNESEQIRYQVTRPLDYDELIETLSDENHIIAGSLAAQDDDSRLLNQLLVQYNQIDPTKDAKDGTNYREGFVSLDVGSQSAREHNQVFSNQINGRWHPSSNRVELIAIADRMLQARSEVPIKVEFEVDRKDDTVKTAQFVTLETAAVCDAFGISDPMIVRIIQQDAGDDTVKYTAREELMATGFARWAPDSIAEGTTYTAATDEQKRRYLFWANNTTGKLGGSDNGKKWL